jgi:long-subunit acyl-CoA synthetase (AMP-forming)
LKNEAATRETIDETGWLHTGDVGMFIEGGRLRIFDRKKAIFKLAQGEYISPERIEAVHTKSPLILQSFVWVRRLILAGDTADPFSCCAHSLWSHALLTCPLARSRT